MPDIIRGKFTVISSEPKPFETPPYIGTGGGLGVPGVALIFLYACLIICGGTVAIDYVAGFFE